MEDKENSGGSANTSSSEEPLHAKKESIKFPVESTTSINLGGKDSEDLETEDLSLHLELDESATLKETQDEYRMFSRITSPEETKNVSQCDKETQEFQLSKSMDEGQFSPRNKHIDIFTKDNSDSNTRCDANGQMLLESKAKGSAKRILDSQGMLYNIGKAGRLNLLFVI